MAKPPPLFQRAPWEPKPHPLVDRAASRARALQVLAPDATMESLGSEARSFVDDCANELWACAFAAPVVRADRFEAMGAISTNLFSSDNRWTDGQTLIAQTEPTLEAICASEREREPRTVVVRSMREGLARWFAGQDPTRRTPLGFAKSRLDQALLSHEALAMALHYAIRAGRDDATSAGAVPYAAAAYECIVRDLLWNIAFESPSPFAVQLRMWERGVWPVWTHQGELVVFCPALGEDSRPLCEPDDPRACAPRMWDEREAGYCALEDQPPCALDELVVLTSTTAPTRIWLDREAEGIVIGRSRDCDIVLDSDTVSRRHCELSWRGGGWTVADTRSTGGTFVNQLRVSDRVSLTGGDLILPGRPWLLFIGSRQ